MPSIDAIRAQPVLPPDETSAGRNRPVGPRAPDEVQRQGDTLDLSATAAERAARIEEPRRAEVAFENVRSSAAPEPEALANDYGRAAIEQRDIRFYSIAAGAPAPLEILRPE